MTKRQRIVAKKLQDKFGMAEADAKAFSKEILLAIKPAPGAPGSAQTNDDAPGDGDDGGHSVGPGGHG